MGWGEADINPRILQMNVPCSCDMCEGGQALVPGDYTLEQFGKVQEVRGGMLKLRGGTACANALDYSQ